MGRDDEPETRADVARRRLAQLAAAFDADLPPDSDDESEPDRPETTRRWVLPSHLRVVTAVGAAACVLLAWYLLAQRPHAGEPIEPVGFAASSAAPTAGPELVIDVIGKVKRPGIVTLARGSRVYQAVEAAGGVTDAKVDTASLNMARLLEDGEQIVVGGAHEAGGVQGLGDADRGGVDAVPVQPGAVLVEVGTRGADQDRPGAELSHAEGDVGADSAAPYVQLVDQEGERDRVQPVRDELIGEPAGEGHEVVGGDGAGDCDTHGVIAPGVRGNDSSRYPVSRRAPPGRRVRGNGKTT